MDNEQKLQQVNPVTFADGRTIFKRFMDEYVVHPKGFFIAAPSGSGKTHFIKQQKEKHWIDGDILWMATGAHPPYEWWNDTMDVIQEVDQRSDVITSQARKLGLWIIGASNYWLTPDAIVLPDWSTHQQYIIDREKNHYDGGATQKDFEQVLQHRDYLAKLAKDENLPVFQTVASAASHLENSV